MSSTTHKILVVEDEPDVAELLKYNLERAGHSVTTAPDGLKGLDAALEGSFDLLILDLMLPEKDGYSVYKDLRGDDRTRELPVLILTARGLTEDRIKGLEMGADDYLTKPFSPKELVLRAETILRRNTPEKTSDELKVGPLKLNKDSLAVIVDGEEIPLTSTEFKILRAIAQNPGETVHRQEILNLIWGSQGEANSRTLDSHVTRLRRKIAPYEHLLKTVRSAGYRFEVE